MGMTYHEGAVWCTAACHWRRLVACRAGVYVSLGLVPCVGCASHPVAAADLLWVVPAVFPSSLRAVCRLVSRANNVPKAQAYFQQGGVGNPANPTYAKVGRKKNWGWREGALHESVPAAAMPSPW